MGKGLKAFGGSPGAFVHKASSKEKSSKVTRNVKRIDHGTKERKTDIAKDLRVKALENRVTKQKALMTCFGGFDGTDLKKEAPNFHLIGPARAALAHYLPTLPGYKPPVEARNLLLELSGGKMWEHEEGRKLLFLMHDQAIKMYNLLNKTRQAIAICSELLQMDPADHIQARHSLLRFYLDNAMGEQARELIQVKFASDRSALLVYSLALLEHISFDIISEPGSSLESKNGALSKAASCNSYLLFMLANLSHFRDGIFEFTDRITINTGDSSSNSSSSSSSSSSVEDEEDRYEPVPGSIEEAIAFLEADSELWLETEGALDWVENFCAPESAAGKEYSAEAMLKRVDEDIARRSKSGNKSSSSSSGGGGGKATKNADMFLLMFKTGVELLLD